MFGPNTLSVLSPNIWKGNILILNTPGFCPRSWPKSPPGPKKPPRLAIKTVIPLSLINFSRQPKTDGLSNEKHPKTERIVTPKMKRWRIWGKKRETNQKIKKENLVPSFLNSISKIFRSFFDFAIIHFEINLSYQATGSQRPFNFPALGVGHVRALSSDWFKLYVILVVIGCCNCCD